MKLPQRAPIVSEYRDEPEMLELIEHFVAEMPGHIKKFRAAWDRRRLADLQRLAHQLKGAAGGYGFSLIGDTAAELESRLEEGEPEALDDIRELVESLLDLCHRAAAR